MKSFKNDLLFEKFITDYEDKISDEYKNLKLTILNFINDTIEDKNEKSLKKFINDYIDSGITLNGFIESKEIFDLYLKYQNDIDDILNKDEYFTNITGLDVNSIYDFVVNSTKIAVKSLIKLIKKEI